MSETRKRNQNAPEDRSVETSTGPSENVDVMGGSGASGGRAVLPNDVERDGAQKRTSSLVAGDGLSDDGAESDLEDGGPAGGNTQTAR
ncbi:MAG: hypothetical protein GIW95_11025 [Candidatus Eremiobacteraeota bacterium]|nr:hypothetical protein [Candidatus Eremiobacteraeota bacterium]